MEIRQLECFETVCKLKSFTKAAEKLHIAQPSITVAIQKLEEELGVQLFLRSQKRFSLTPQGEVFLERVENILLRVNNAVSKMNDFKQLENSTIRVGIPPMIGSYYFPLIFSKFKPSHSNVNVLIYELGTGEITELIENGELDLGLVILSSSTPLLEVMPVGKVEILLCLSKEHKLAKKPDITFSMLKDEPFILIKEGTFLRRKILEKCAKSGFKPNVIFSPHQIETIRELVSKDLGISFLFDVIARKNSDMLCRSMADPLCFETAVVWFSGKHLSKHSREFIDFLKSIPD